MGAYRRLIFIPHVVRGMGSHCAPNVNKTQLAQGLNQVLDEFVSNLRSSVNNGFRHMITNVLIQKVLRIRGWLGLKYPALLYWQKRRGGLLTIRLTAF
jgi:hypothetical protein